MQDLLRISDAGGAREFVLPRGLVTLGAETTSTIALRTTEPAPAFRSLQWESRRACWHLLRAENGTASSLKINGRALAGAEQVTLSHLDIIEAPGVLLQFERILAEPIYHGAPRREIPLTGAVLVLGGGRDLPEEPNLVQLDAEDPFISRVHARIIREGEDHFLEDLSSHGSELNGAAFRRERLVFGDRFRISGYLFEFIGAAIRYIQPEFSGSVTARALTVQAGGKRILDGVSLVVSAGEFIGVLGRSGQGKSTLLNALCGVHPATSGQVCLGGVPLWDRARLRAVGVGYVPQDDIVHKELTVWNAISFSARLRVNLPPRSSQALVERVIDQLGLTPHRAKRVEQLSGGQRKRVSIAIELLAKPSVLFLDEPSSGLDPATEAELMTLLQSLTLTKLTVVCTTHVLHKAYLFDRMLVIEGGKLVFAGRSDDARVHFLLHDGDDSGSLETTPLEEIYTRLQNADRSGERTPADWEQEFLASAFAARATPPLPSSQPAKALPSPHLRVSSWRTLRTLAARQWSILRADGLNLLFLLMQPVLIGVLLGWVTNSMAQRLFLCVVATMWFGCSNGAQQIVAELPIFRRERVCGQSLHAYLLSKLGFLSAVSLTQALILFLTAITAASSFQHGKVDTDNAAKDFARRLTPVVTIEAASPAAFEAVGSDSGPSPAAGSPAPTAPEPVDPASWRVRSLAALSEFFGVSQNVLDSGPRLLKRSDGTVATDRGGQQIALPGLPVTQVLLLTLGLRGLALAAATFVSVSIGLAISALVKNTTQAVLWVPLVLIPQILFGGILVAVPEMTRSVWFFSHAMPSFSAQRIMDVASVFGCDTPAFSNRTKTPLFLSSLGEKETVEWTEGGDDHTQDYDKLSPVNASWQNVLVQPSRLGRHKWETAPYGQGGYTYPDSVEQRGDVLLHKGIPFRSLTLSNRATAVLFLWCLLSYATMVAGLSARQPK